MTVALGSLESGRGGYVQDATGGIAVYLDGTQAVPIAAGRRVRLQGTMDERYGQRTLRVAASSIEVGEEDDARRLDVVIRTAAGASLGELLDNLGALEGVRSAAVAE